jgi:hypothetical protein
MACGSFSASPVQASDHTMTKREGKVAIIDLKRLLARDTEVVRVAVEAQAQAIVEAEMSEVIGAAGASAPRRGLPMTAAP